MLNFPLFRGELYCQRNWLRTSLFLVKRNKLERKILSNMGPRIDHCGTANNIFPLEL